MAVPYMTPDQIRAVVGALADVGKYPDTVLADLVAEFEEIAEEYRGVAFTPRTAVETQTVGLGTASIVLNRPFVRSITSVVVDGVTIDALTYRSAQPGLLESSAGFVAGGAYLTSTAVVTYEHGMEAPPQRLLRCCREYVRICAVADRSNVPRDIIATSADGMSTRFSTPDARAGRPTGYLEVDRLLNRLPGIA
jgi:hypothetical protein